MFTSTRGRRPATLANTLINLALGSVVYGLLGLAIYGALRIVGVPLDFPSVLLGMLVADRVYELGANLTATNT